MERDGWRRREGKRKGGVGGSKRAEGSWEMERREGRDEEGGGGGRMTTRAWMENNKGCEKRGRGGRAEGEGEAE